jgi:aspartate carbamoyltransferase regulatory subunit
MPIKYCNIKMDLHEHDPRNIHCFTDCGNDFVITRSNKWRKYWKKYHAQFPIQHRSQQYVECPFCNKIANFYNPYDDGETWRIED